MWPGSPTPWASTHRTRTDHETRPVRNRTGHPVGGNSMDPDETVWTEYRRIHSAAARMY